MNRILRKVDGHISLREIDTIRLIVSPITPTLGSDDLILTPNQVSELSNIPVSKIQCFQDSGYRFVKAPQLPSTTPSLKMFVTNDEQPVVLLNVATIQFPENVGPSDIEIILAKYHGQIIRNLEFAPGFYEVEFRLPEGKDMIDVANQIIENEHIVSIEPEMMQIHTPRR